MAIYFKDDWNKYPDAIPHLTTKNRSWVRMALVLRDKFKLQNYQFHLALLDPGLEHIDPHDPSLPEDMKLRVKIECGLNPWYFFREVMKVPAKAGVGANQFRCNRFVLSSIFLHYNHIDIAAVIMRQVGKSLTAQGIKAHLLSSVMWNSSLLWVTTNAKKQRDTIRGTKDILKLLPDYIYKAHPKYDADNMQEITNYARNNYVLYGVGQADKKRAEENGRGYQLAVKMFDEVAECKNSHIIIGAASGASNAVVDEARAKGEPYGDILLCTAGDLARAEGLAYHTYMMNSAMWDEAFYDTDNQDALKEMVAAQSADPRAPSVNLTFSWRQLGISKERYLEIRARAIRDSAGDMDKVRREVDSIWSMGGKANALTPDQANVVHNSEIDPLWVDTYQKKVIVRWYVTKNEILQLCKENRAVVGCDTSQGNGRDSCSHTVTDVATGAVLGRVDVSTINLNFYTQFCIWFILSLPKSLFIIENKVSGQAIIDAMIIAFVNAGEDPMKRMYNMVVQEPEKYQAYEHQLNTVHVSRRKHEFYNHMKHAIGFSTNKMLRQQLYDQALQEAVRMSGSTIRDKTLSEQMRTLIRKNGRVDHPEGGHDDAVISYLLCMWFLIFGKNYSKYGIPLRLPLSQTVRTEDGSTSKEDLERHHMITWLEGQIEKMEQELRMHHNTFYGKSLEVRLNDAFIELERLGGEPRNLAQLLDDIKQQKRG